MELTYRAWAERTHRLANALVGLGVQPGDRVSFITYNTHHLLEGYYGVLEAGAVLNPVNIRLAPHEIAWILGHAESRVVFFHKDFTPLVEQIASQLSMRPRFVVLEGEAGGVASDEYEALLAGGSVRAAPPRRRRERAWPSSSTRAARPGVPKGVVADPPQPVPPRPRRADRPRVRPRTTSSSTSCPLFHVNGWGSPTS